MPGGASAPFLSSSFGFLGSLFTSPGGAKTSISATSSYVHKDNSLRVNNSVGSVNLSNKKVDKDLTLDSKFQTLDISQNKKVSYDSSKDAAVNIHKEIKKEKEVHSIESRRTKKFSTVVNRLKPVLKSYLQAKQKFQKLKKEGAPLKQVWVDYPVPFDANDRKTILKVYEGNDELFDDKKNFASELQRSSGNNSLFLQSSVNSRKGRRTVINELRRTGWDNASYEEIEFTGRNVSIPSKQNNYGWGNWNNNPFRHFIDNQQKFLQLIEGVKLAQNSLSKYMESKRAATTFAIFLGTTGQSLATPDKPRLLQKITDAKLKVYFEVIGKLMSWMGQEL